VTQISAEPVFTKSCVF